MKRAANLSIETDLLDQAKALKINLSQTLEEALRQKVRTKLGEEWLKENRAAIESYNEYIAKNGLPLARYRRF